MSEIIIVHAGEAAALDPTQSGFAHGFGIFETMKLAAGRLCFWEAHWDRLCASARFFDLELTVDADAVLAAIGELVRADALQDGTIKLSLLRNGTAARLFVYARPASVAPVAAKLKLDVRYPINQHSLLAGRKTHNYMENMALYQAARAEGFWDTLRLNTSGHIAETSTGNFFFIRKGRVYTPALDTGILPGVIRGDLLMLCDVTEGQYTQDDLQLADAAFMTNSSWGILPVEQLIGGELALNWASQAHPLIGELNILLAAAELEFSIVL